MVKRGCGAGDASGPDGESCVMGDVSWVARAAAVEARRTEWENGRDRATRHDRQTCNVEPLEDGCAARYRVSFHSRSCG